MRQVYLIGIGGAGQRAVAELLLDRGIAVSGSDAQASVILEDLRRKGAHVNIGHDARNLGDADLVVVSSAIPSHNPEVEEARRRLIPVIKNAELLRRLMEGKRGLAVAGTHGKTTTTGMLASVLVAAGMDPDAVVGGDVKTLGCSGRAGAGDFFVVEADEYDRRFLQLSPELAILTSVEPDHVDYYGSEEALYQAFGDFVARLPRGGLLVACSDVPGCRPAASRAVCPVEWYGLGDQPDPGWVANDLILERERTRFRVAHDGVDLGPFELRILGRHNVSNALAVIVASAHLGVHVDVVRRSLAAYEGARRRFDVVGQLAGVHVIADYAHLPTEIRVTLAATRQRMQGSAGRLWACFQPHTYARTLLLLQEFSHAFADADHVVIVATYAPPGREVPDDDEAASELTRSILSVRGEGRYAATLADLVAILSAETSSGDVVLLLGAGDVIDAGQMFLAGAGRR